MTEKHVWYKNRNLILTVLTLGLYGYVYYFKLMRFVNRYKGEQVYQSVKVVVLIILLLVFVILMLFLVVGPRLYLLEMQILFIFFWVLIVCWIVFICSFGFYHAAWHIREIEEQLGIRRPINPVATFVWFFAGFAVINYIDIHRRAIVDQIERRKQAYELECEKLGVNYGDESDTPDSM